MLTTLRQVRVFGSESVPWPAGHDGLNLQGGIAVVRGSCVASCVVAMCGRSPGTFCVQGEKRGRIAHFSDDIRPGYVCLLHVPAMRCWAQFAHDTSRGCLWVRVLAGRLSRELAPCCRSFLCSTLRRCGAWGCPFGDAVLCARLTAWPVVGSEPRMPALQPSSATCDPRGLHEEYYTR